MRVHASLLFFLAVALLVKPLAIGQFIGFKSTILTADFFWALRILGSLLLLPALLGPIVAAFAGERGLRQACSGMAFISLVVGTTMLLAPVGVTTGKIATTSAWYLFALLYFYALRGRGRNR
jgi:hypothetical protein